MLRTFLFVSALSLAVPAYSFEYAMVKGDTLWSLSKRYLKDPYLWPQITYLDGTAVKDPRRMPIGTLLLIPKSIANDRALIELEDSQPLPVTKETPEVVTPVTEKPHPKTTDHQNVKKNEDAMLDGENSERAKNDLNKAADLKNSVVSAYVSNPSLLAIVERLDANQRNRLWDYWLKHNDGLVRAYYNGQEVVIEAQLLIDEMRHMESKNQ